MACGAIQRVTPNPNRLLLRRREAASKDEAE